jgi:hypothetical protein
MAQYWLQVPIENAKEMVQRIIQNSGDPVLASKTVTYSSDSEIVFYNLTDESVNNDPYTFYFGSLYVLSDKHETGLHLACVDSSTVTFKTVVNAATESITAGKYEYLIWNAVLSSSTSDANMYFVGYKFNLI